MKYINENSFNQANMFGKGQDNTVFSQYFTGNLYLTPLTEFGKDLLFLANITFEPGCRNNWHIHHSKSGGGQMLISTAGEGWYQEEGNNPISLSEGSLIYIPTCVKHWHGAKSDS